MSEKKSIITTINESIQQGADNLGLFIEKNGKTLTIALGTFLGVCVLYFGYSYYAQSVALKKFDSAFTLEKKISDFMISDMDSSDKIKTKKTPETDATEFNQINTEVLAFVKENSSNEASRNLALKWSSYLNSVDQFEKSKEVLSALNLRSKSTLDGLAMLAQASTNVQLGQFTEAIELYKKVIANKKWNYVHPEARFQMSLALIENKNEPEALDNLKLISSEYPKETKTIEEANKIIRWLTFKNNEKK